MKSYKNLIHLFAQLKHSRSLKQVKNDVVDISLTLLENH